MKEALIKEEAVHERAAFGFWIYLMTDLIIFAVLFATYAVLRGNTFGGPSSDELFSINGALLETLILLTSSFTCGLMVLAVERGKRTLTTVWLAITFALGATFLGLELREFGRFIAQSATWQS